MNGAIPTSHAFSKPSFMPNASQAYPAPRMMMCPSAIATKSRGTERSQPRSLSQPVDEGRRHEADEIAAGRTEQGRKAANRTGKYRKSDRPFRQIGNDRRAAETPTIGRADHQHDQRLQRHRHVWQRQIDLGRQRQQRRSQRDRMTARSVEETPSARCGQSTAASGKCLIVTDSGIELADKEISPVAVCICRCRVTDCAALCKPARDAARPPRACPRPSAHRRSG